MAGAARTSEGWARWLCVAALGAVLCGVAAPERADAQDAAVEAEAAPPPESPPPESPPTEDAPAGDELPEATSAPTEGASPAAALDPVAEAQALFRRGLELGAENRWADALEHFRRSYARVPRPSTLFNIGVALGRLGRFVEAIAVFDELFAGVEPPPPAAQAEAERLRAEAVASLAELSLELDPPAAALYVDGAARPGEGSPRSVPLDPGRHVLRATADEHVEGSLEVSVVAGEHPSAGIALARVIIEPEILPVVPPPPGPSIFEEPAFWIVGGAIVVVLGVGIGLGVGLGAASPAPQYGGTTGVVLLAP